MTVGEWKESMERSKLKTKAMWTDADNSQINYCMNIWRKLSTRKLWTPEIMNTITRKIGIPKLQ